MNMSTIEARVPPHSVEAEQSTLGALLMNNDAFDLVPFLAPEDFYRHDHRIIFISIVQLIGSNRPADVLTVYEWLATQSKAEEVGGLPYLNALVQTTPSSANIAYYAKLVWNRSVARRMITACEDIIGELLRSGGRDLEAIRDRAESSILSFGERSHAVKSDFLPLKQLLAEAVERIDQAYHSANQSGITGLATGFRDLDRELSGLQAGDLIIVAGRPSMGKTAFSVNIAENVAMAGEQAVAVFSMEMGGAQLAMRMLGSVGRLDQQRLRSGNLRDEDWPRITHGIQKLDNARIFIDETPGLTVMSLKAKARRLAKRQGGLGLIVIDYIQLMAGPDDNAGMDNRSMELGQITRELKGLAKELQCPIIALSQLNRGLEQRPNKRPVMSDLRESGAIEQDADVILFIYRDEVYNPESADKGIAEIIIGKQRNGPIGTVRLSWAGQYTQFNNLAHSSS
jgi:replicative DNA helicase